MVIDLLTVNSFEATTYTKAVVNKLKDIIDGKNKENTVNKFRLNNSTKGKAIQYDSK